MTGRAGDRPRRGRPSGPVSITTALPSLSADVAARQRRYLLTMGIRTVSFVLAVLFTEGWLQWVCIVAAVVLPYVAVIRANAGREYVAPGPEAYVPDQRPALGPGPESGDATRRTER